MAEVTLTIGAAAVCGDGFPGELKSVVVDPASRAVTHLVIEPKRERGSGVGLARLVPLDHADAAAEPIRMAYTEAEFKDLRPAEETLAEFVPGYEVPVQLLPAGEGWRAADGPVADGETIPQIREMETIPLIPDNEAGTPEVEESGADHVAPPTATSGGCTGCAWTRPAERCSRCCSRSTPGGTRSSPSPSARCRVSKRGSSSASPGGSKEPGLKRDRRDGLDLNQLVRVASTVTPRRVPGAS